MSKVLYKKWKRDILYFSEAKQIISLEEALIWLSSAPLLLDQRQIREIPNLYQVEIFLNKVSLNSKDKSLKLQGTDCY